MITALNTSLKRTNVTHFAPVASTPAVALLAALLFPNGLQAGDPLPDGNYWLTVEVPAELERYVVWKGSIALNGISLTVARLGEVIEILASARSFLHNQVRNMVGSLALVGEGKWTGADLAAALAARDRAAAGPCAPPEGLYLVAVEYPKGS